MYDLTYYSIQFYCTYIPFTHARLLTCSCKTKILSNVAHIAVILHYLLVLIFMHCR